jgi:hypothetical protein
MTPDERADELACDLLRVYMALGEAAIVIRTRGAEVSTIMPNGDRPYIAELLRRAADSIERHEAPKRLN